MPTMNESIYETHTQLFTPQFYNNIKTLTEVRKMQKYGGHSRLTKSEFDKYLMILFTMMISGKERGSVQDNWSKNTKIRNQFIADEVGMSCREWEEIHSNVCYGHIKLLLDQPEEEIDTNLDGIESDEEESENSDYEYDEDDLEELNKIFNDHEEEVLSQNKPKETKVRNSVSRVQDFMLQLQSKFRDIYTKYPDYFLGKNLVIDEQLIKFAGRIFFLQYNPAKPAKRGILVRACVDTFTNFILSMDLYAASQTVPKGETKTLDVIKRLIDFPKQPNCTLFCDNYYGTIDVVEYIKSIGLEYVGTFRPSRLGKELSQNLEKLQLNQVVQYPVFKEVKLKKTTKQVLVKDVNVLQWQCKKQKTLTMIYTKSKFVKQPCQMQEFVSSRGIPREQPEIVRYYNNNYKGVDYVDQLTKNIKFPGRCTRWTTRMFIYFMQVILVNGFSLMKLLHPEYKEIKITDYVESIIDQMKINLTKYEIKATPRKIEGCNQPVVSPIKGPVIEAYKHYHVYTKVSAQCVGCKQCNSRYVCSCKGYHLCPECYKTHISEQNDIRGYTHIYKK
ncbi:Transposase_IS4 [Hexamita inflata]|uniref:Transposase IS4 n=2 Tax=Hexamita inflata TaxID=28002 RepID=A0AA86TK99_9EUKA|nr:Transposase IS4 [Hexamita inflata]CAI9918805.1 Transposase IS4 [Hexamita inflata]CAI9932444.1 Transposase IS4 [Hexamita inflata]CAI9958098.1 Transposase IS4 [Hexamita inflata]CAI9958203.1 Transposase IS4 [Hexamita inflata]